MLQKTIDIAPNKAIEKSQTASFGDFFAKVFHRASQLNIVKTS